MGKSTINEPFSWEYSEYVAILMEICRNGIKMAWWYHFGESRETVRGNSQHIILWERHVKIGIDFII